MFDRVLITTLQVISANPTGQKSIEHMGQGIQKWTKKKLWKASFKKFYLVHFWIPWPICFFPINLLWIFSWTSLSWYSGLMPYPGQFSANLWVKYRTCKDFSPTDLQELDMSYTCSGFVKEVVTWKLRQLFWFRFV